MLVALPFHKVCCGRARHSGRRLISRFNSNFLSLGVQIFSNQLWLQASQKDIIFIDLIYKQSFRYIQF